MKRFVLAGSTVAAIAGLTAVMLVSFDARRADAHCQVPCGIYDDEARINRLKEDSTTIKKAITSIRELGTKADSQSFNQAARWVATKEDHASHIIDVVAQYFLTQRVKAVAQGADGYDAYLKSLADHHAVMSAAMKCKQNANHEVAASLNAAIDALAKHYQ